MILRQQLERADNQLRELHNEHGTRFDFTLNVITRAHQLALKAKAADAAKVVENVTAPLSPRAGRRLLAAMMATLTDKPDTLDPPMVAKELKVSPDTVRNWIRTKQLRATNIANKGRARWIIQRSELERFLRLRSI